ncbi:MAG: hypothetical protein AAGJ81_00575 [Verrucomicrobiota bacterium]
MGDSVKAPRWVGWCSVVILCFGCLQFIGYLLGSATLRGIGAACGFAPYTKVFSDVDGFETFAADFSLVLKTDDGEQETIVVTPEFYRQLKGPYNRRNVYGAALSYAPRLPEELWQSVFCYGVNGPLREEFGISDDVSEITVLIQTRTKGRDDRWSFKPPCLE